MKEDQMTRHFQEFHKAYSQETAYCFLRAAVHRRAKIFVERTSHMIFFRISTILPKAQDDSTAARTLAAVNWLTAALLRSTGKWGFNLFERSASSAVLYIEQASMTLCSL